MPATNNNLVSAIKEQLGAVELPKDDPAYKEFAERDAFAKKTKKYFDYYRKIAAKEKV